MNQKPCTLSNLNHADGIAVDCHASKAITPPFLAPANQGGLI